MRPDPPLHPALAVLGPALLLLFLLGGCASLPPNTGRVPSRAMTDTGDTSLGRAYQEVAARHPGQSGFLLLGNGLDALTARLVLAAEAERSIDTQYYLIHDDLTGHLFTAALLEAADRGVRVRVLVDDIDLGGRDRNLAAIGAHPNIELRVFNPFTRGAARIFQFITRFGSVTRRMHNKSFTVDNQVTIVGGRNIGDEYFNADPLVAFADLDLLAVGPVTAQVSASFDDYWNSPLAYPIETLYPGEVSTAQLQAARALRKQRLAVPETRAHAQRLMDSPLAHKLRDKSGQLFWGEAEVLSDDPEKIESYDNLHDYALTAQLAPYLQGLERELLVFSPYFVPGKAGTRFLCDLAARGVEVRLMTNSLASTDVGLVHAGYARYRRTLLRGGVRLYEMDQGLTGLPREKRRFIAGTSKASLHAKSFVLDREYVFVGSFNLDPRSVRENTEIGIMVHCPEMAERMARDFQRILEAMAFEVRAEPDCQEPEGTIYLLSWFRRQDGKERRWPVEPNTGMMQRFLIFCMGLLPIESQL